jgi:predicted permease
MLTALAARYSPRADEIRVDGPVLGFALGLALVVAVILSYAPRFVKETGLGAWLAGAGKSSANRRRALIQRSLVVAQVAVTVMLLTGAGLLTRTLERLTAVDTGLSAEQVVTMEAPVDNGFKRSAVEQTQIYQRVRDQLIALPGVTDVGFGSVVPLRNSDGFQLDVKAEGHDLAPGQAQPRAEYRTASTDYFRAAGIPLVKGRWFEATDITESTPVVIINQTMAAQMFPGVDPVGRHIAWTGEVLKFIGMAENTWRTVVGVVGDTKDNGLNGESRAVVFTPQAQSIFPGGGVIIRARSDAEGMIPAATRVVRSAIPADAPIERVMTVAQIKEESLAPQRLNAMLVGSFSMLAMLIAAVGIAAVLAFSVSARTNEIGIRMSLGADAGTVHRMILSEGGLLVVLGLTIGVLGALLLSRLVQGLLFGVAPHDPVTLAAVSLVMGTVGIAACWIPAIRAARIDPGVALRAQ